MPFAQDRSCMAAHGSDDATNKIERKVWKGVRRTSDQYNLTDQVSHHWPERSEGAAKTG